MSFDPLPTDEPFPRWIVASMLILIFCQVLVRCT